MARDNSRELERAYEAFDAGRYEAALDDADKAMRTAPKDRDAWLLKAACLDALGDYDNALSEYEELTEVFPDDAEIWVHLADLCHHGLDDPEMAVEALTTAVDIAESEEHEDEEMAFEAHLRLVDAYLDLDEHAEALVHAEVARKMNKDDPDAQSAYGQVLFELGRFVEAEKAASLAIDRDAKNPSAWFLRALLAERKGDELGARRAMDRVRSVDPEAYPEAIKIDGPRLLALAREVIEEMAPRVRDYLSDVKITVEDLPAEADLRSQGGTLTPSATTSMRGTPLAEERPDNPFTHKPFGLTLYRLNLVRGAADEEELRDRIESSLLAEVGQFLNLSDDEMHDMFSDED